MTLDSETRGAFRPTKSKKKKALFTLVTLILLFAGAEVLCRLAGLGRYEPVAQEIAAWPGGQDFWVFRGPEFNSDGMRDREHEVDKPPGVSRIVCLGDSVTVGHGVKRTQTFSYILESYMRQMGLQVEVFNVAASGWSTLQEAAAYVQIARQYRPDHVFLGFCLNDVAEMHNNLTTKPSPIIGALLRHSALVRWALNAKGRQVSNVRELFDPNPLPAVTDGWAQVLGELETLRAATHADGAVLSVILFPFRFQLEPDAPRRLAQEYLSRQCLKRGIPCLDLLPALRSVGTEAFIDDSHLSPMGAELVARELVRWGKSGCVMCGYDLTGVTTNRCPRCGAVIQR